MRYSTQIKPISDLKANAAEILRELDESREPVIITQNGRAKAVLQDVASYEEERETFALLQLVAIGDREFAEGKFEDARVAIAKIQKG